MDSLDPPRPADALADSLSAREPFSPRDSKPAPQPDAGCTPAAMKELLDSDRVNYLVWRLVKPDSPPSPRPPPGPLPTPTCPRFRALAGAHPAKAHFRC